MRKLKKIIGFSDRIILHDNWIFASIDAADLFDWWFPDQRILCNLRDHFFGFIAVCDIRIRHCDHAYCRCEKSKYSFLSVLYFYKFNWLFQRIEAFFNIWLFFSSYNMVSSVVPMLTFTIFCFYLSVPEFAVIFFIVYVLSIGLRIFRYYNFF